MAMWNDPCTPSTDPFSPLPSPRLASAGESETAGVAQGAGAGMWYPVRPLVGCACPQGPSLSVAATLPLEAQKALACGPPWGPSLPHARLLSALLTVGGPLVSWPSALLPQINKDRQSNGGAGLGLVSGEGAQGRLWARGQGCRLCVQGPSHHLTFGSSGPDTKTGCAPRKCYLGSDPRRKCEWLGCSGLGLTGCRPAEAELGAS